MLSKKFRSNKFYQVTRYTFKYGNEWDEMENTVTVWDTYEKAMAYIKRYSSGLKFASAQIEVNNLDREITYEDYKKGDYNIVSFQKIYDVTSDGTEDTQPEEIVYMNDEKSAATDEQLTNEEQSAEPPVKYFAIKGYPAQFSNLRAAINFAKGIKVKRELVIYVVKQSQDAHMVNLEPVSTIEAYVSVHYMLRLIRLNYLLKTMNSTILFFVVFNVLLQNVFYFHSNRTTVSFCNSFYFQEVFFLQS